MSEISATVLTIAGASVAAYVAVRVGLATLQATMTTSFGDINRRLDRMESSRDNHAEDINAIKVAQARYESVQASHNERLHILERTRTGSYGALSADSTGPHKVGQ